ncbi:hypothetical protein KCV05_g23400, partial [Aureobasidium melanogenum]
FPIPLDRALLHNIRQHKLRAQARIDASSDLVNHHRYITPSTSICPRPFGDFASIRFASSSHLQSCRRTGLQRSLAYVWAR